jgi:hypothetical protein
MHTHSPIAAIISALKGGDVVPALEETERLLANNPKDSDLLGLKGLALAMNGRQDEAIRVVRQALTNAKSPSQRLKHAGNLARLLAHGDRHDELKALTTTDLPPLESLKEYDFDAAAVEDLCATLLTADCHAFVGAYLEPVLDWRTLSWELERLWLTAANGAAQYDKILARCDRATHRWRDQPELLAFASLAASALEREEDYNRLYKAYLTVAPVHVSQRCKTQIMSIVLVSPNPPSNMLSLPAPRQHFIYNFPSQLAVRRPDRYHFISVFAGSEPRNVADKIALGERAIVLNNNVNGEILRSGMLVGIQRHEQALGLPVINPASQALHCTRQKNAESLRGIPNLVVPKVMRFRLWPAMVDELCRSIAELFVLPVLLRTVAEQEGRNVYLVANKDQLIGALTELIESGEKEFYVIEYVGVTHANGFFRRIRAAYVERVPTIMRVDYDKQWMVKGRKIERIVERYRTDPELLQLANSFVEQPNRLGEVALTVLAEIGRRIPLDVFGIDFDVDDQDRVVFFEANATMNLLSTAIKEFDYPKQAEEEFLARLDRFLIKRAGISIQ